MDPNNQKKFILGIIEADKIDPAVFLQFQRQFCKQNGSDFLKKDELFKAYQKMVKNGTIKPRADLEKILQLKNIRSQSGIAVVSVLTKPYSCPGECIFCPTEEGVPKSYLSNEPAVMRAIANDFDPYRQVQSRLTALAATGHLIDKISIRIIGASWSYYPLQYRSKFINKLYQACNDFSGSVNGAESLVDSQLRNETSRCRIVELSVETRPDMINSKEIDLLRRYGVTKVELGVQSLDDDVLRANKRGNTKADIARATRLLKEAGFKVSYQMMLNLFTSDSDVDVEQFRQLFSNEEFCPDHLKIYPLALVRNSGLYEKYLKGLFKPYDKQVLVELLAKVKALVPPYCRIERVIRDIPADEIVEGGAAISNLRQEIEKFMKQHGKKCKCIRCREIKGNTLEEEPELIVRKYSASGGDEYFLSFEDQIHDRLIGFCRLRIDEKATIREIHVYGPTVAIGLKNETAQQHKGYGKKLVLKAEEISRFAGRDSIRVIAGVGVRTYFEKLGYKLRRTYMEKPL